MLPTSNPTGSYSDRQYDRVRGFRALAHAEFEAFLEDRVVESANNALALFGTSGGHVKVIMSLIAFHEGGWGKSAATLRDRADKARSHFVNRVRNTNNGIREANVLAMLVPVGVEAFQLSQTWLNTIDTYGKVRGRIAHTAAHTQQPPDPLIERAAASQVLSGLKDVDELINALM